MAKYSLRQSAGPLLRRNHQIGLAIFAEEFKGTDLTPLQYSILWTLLEISDVDQGTLAQAVALDKNTCSNILSRLEKAGRVKRSIDPNNRRIKLVSITQEGRQLMAQLEKPMARVQKKIIEPLEPEERKQFLRLLAKLADSNNDLSRAPMAYLPLK